MVKRKTILLGLLSVVSLGILGFVGWELYARWRLRELLGEQTMTILLGATRVEVFRVRPEGSVKSDDQEASKTMIGGHRITVSGGERDEEYARRLTTVILDKQTYRFHVHNPVFGIISTCAFRPGVGFRVFKGQEAVEILLCFNCNEMRILSKDAEGNVTHRAIGEFKPMRLVLLQLCKEGFPADSEIQELRDVRGS